MWNPFKAVANAVRGASEYVASGIVRGAEAVQGAVGRAGDAASRQVGNIVQSVRETVSRPFGGQKEAPQPPAPQEAPRAPVGGTISGAAVGQPEEGPMLPPSMIGGKGETAGAFEGREGAMTDGEIRDKLQEAIGNAGIDRDSLEGSARDWADNPDILSIVDQWATGSGFSSEQWASGVKEISDVRISQSDDGSIWIEIDVDVDIDGDSGDVGGRTMTAVF